MNGLDELTACLPKAGGGLKAWFAYVILCNDGSLYKGHTNNIIRRYKEHCLGMGARHTAKHKPVKVVLLEGCDTLEQAVAREKYYKSGVGREWLKKNIKEDGIICLNLVS